MSARRLHTVGQKCAGINPAPTNGRWPEVEPCENLAKCKGLCTRHYDRHRNRRPDRASARARRWKRYSKTPNGRAARNRSVRRYQKTPKGRAAHKAAMKRYYRTPKGRAAAFRSSARRRARIKQATPKWADRAAIDALYESCPKGYAVDHIVPLAGRNVCGLHVHYNLEIVDCFSNKSKFNFLMDVPRPTPDPMLK